MKISDFDYILPEEKIAIHPPQIRGKSKLLVLNKETGEIQHKNYFDLHEYFQEGDVLVLNNTKVIKARLKAEKITGGKVELIILEKHREYSQIVMYRGHLKVNDELLITSDKLNAIKTVRLKVLGILGNGLARVESEENLEQLAEQFGNVPIPPYMNREADTTDIQRYQTVFAQEKGSVAAPTASLNFTEELHQKLVEKGVKVVYITLHVGLGTFLPIRADDVEEHEMHKEYYSIPIETVEAIRRAKKEGRNIFALGTTVTRTLEYTANQILNSNAVEILEGEADIFIYPGYDFKIVDRLITNFHAPRSTVLMLAAAFAGWENLKKAYEMALEKDYKFLSYGDSMIII